MARIAPQELLSIGAVAERAGVSVAAIRHYDQRGLLPSARAASGHRRFPRHALRRLAVIAAGQRVGLSLAEIGDALADLPLDRAPTQRDWNRVSRRWAAIVHERIRVLERLADDLDGCIGCGCLSLGRCTLFNPGDAAAADGPGARWLRSALAPEGRQHPPE